MKPLSRWAVIMWVASLLWANQLWANESDPVKMLDSLTSRVMAELQQHHSELKQHPNRIFAIVNHLILPHVDFVEMSKWVAGRNAWQRTSPAVQAQFIEAFKSLVVRTYATALLHYDNQEIEFLPLRPGSASKNRVQVETVVKKPSRQPVRMNYRLIRTPQGWLVYDIVIEGVSLLKGYQSQYSDLIRTQGIEAAIAKMKEQYDKMGTRRRG